MADDGLPRTCCVYTVFLSGDIDLHRESDLDDIVETYRHSDAVHVVIDVAGVTLVDPTGLGHLARLIRDANDRGGSVTVTHDRRAGQSARTAAGSGLSHVSATGRGDDWAWPTDPAGLA